MKNIFLFIALTFPVFSQIRLPNPSTWSNNYIGSNVRRYDAFMQYGATGSAVTTATVGTVSSGATSATVLSCASFLPGNGFYIIGAGPLVTSVRAPFVGVVNSCSGTTLAWTGGTNATVTTGAVVKHEDVTAIDNAIAAAFNAGGGQVFLPPGVYHGAQFDAITGGCVTYPQNNSVVNPFQVDLIGEIPGNFNTPGVGGVTIDCSDLPNVASVGGVTTAILSGAPYITTTTGNYPGSFNGLGVGIYNIMFIAPDQPLMHGLGLWNVLQARLDHFYIFSLNAGAASPTGGTVGVWMPQYLNNVDLYIGAGTVAGFNTGAVGGEHTIFNGTYLGFNNYCLGLVQSQHVIGGRIRCEATPHMINNTSASEVILDLTIDGEVTPGAGTWWQRGTDVTDASDLLFGKLNYMFLSIPSAAFATVTKSGGTNLLTCNLGVAPTAGACTP